MDHDNPYPPIINVRPATAADVPAIAGIHAHYVLHTVVSFGLEPNTDDAMLAKFTAIREKGLPFLVAVDVTSAWREGDGADAAVAGTVDAAVVDEVGGVTGGAAVPEGIDGDQSGVITADADTSAPDSLAVAAAVARARAEEAIEQGIAMDLDAGLDALAASEANADPTTAAWSTSGSVVGFAYVSPFRSALGGYRHTVELSLFCHPAYTNRGAGSLLLRRVVDILENPALYGSEWAGISASASKEGQEGEAVEPEGVEEVLAVMALDNAEGGKGWELRDWYEKFGFKQVGHLRRVGRKFGRWVDTVYLQYSIHPHDDEVIDERALGASQAASTSNAAQSGKRRSTRKAPITSTGLSATESGGAAASAPVGDDGQLLIDPELQHLENPSTPAAAVAPASNTPIPPIGPALDLSLRFPTRHEAREYINQISMRLGFTVRFSHYSKGKGRAYIDCTRGGTARFRKSTNGDEGEDDGEDEGEDEGEGESKAQGVQNLNQADNAEEGASQSTPKTKIGRRRGQSHRIGCPFRLILKENRPESDSDLEMDLGLGLVPPTDSLVDPNIDPALVDAAAAAAAAAVGDVGSLASPSTAVNPRKRARSSLGGSSHQLANLAGDDDDAAIPGVYWTIAILRDVHSHSADPPSSLPAARRFTPEDLRYIEAAHAAKQKPRAMLKHFKKRNHPALAKDLYNVLSRMKRVKKEAEAAEAAGEGAQVGDESIEGME